MSLIEFIHNLVHFCVGHVASLQLAAALWSAKQHGGGGCTLFHKTNITGVSIITGIVAES